MHQLSLKELILTQLDFLKSMGKDRRTIEKELGYSENYIDHAVSSGGNQKFYNALVKYRERLEGGEDVSLKKSFSMAKSQQETIEILTKRLDRALEKIEELENKISQQEKSKPHRRSA